MVVRNKFLISGWLIYFFLIAGLYFSELIFLDDNNWFKFTSVEEIIPFFIGTILILVLYFIIDKKRNQERANFLFLAFLTFLFLIYVLVILFLPESRELKGYIRSEEDDKIIMTAVTQVFNVTISDKIYYILLLGINLPLIYLYLVVFPKETKSFRVIDIFYILCSIFALVMIVFSLIKEWDKYVYFFAHFFVETFNIHYHITSFLVNKNNFGWFFYFMICFTILMHAKHGKWYYIAVNVIYFILVIISLSKLNFIVSVIAIYGYLTFHSVANMKEHSARSIVVLSIIYFIMIGYIVTTVIGVRMDNPDGYFKFIKDLYYSLSSFKDNAVVQYTFTGRTILWENFFDLMNNIEGSWIFGLGFGYFNTLFLEFTKMTLPLGATNMPHNGYFQIIGEAGMIGILVLIGALIFLIVKCAKNWKNAKNIAFTTIVFIIVSLIHMMFEASAILFYSKHNIEGIAMTLLLFIPILIEDRKEINDVQIEQFINEKDTYHREPYLKDQYSLALVIYNFLNPIFGILSIVLIASNNATPIYLAIMFTVYVLGPGLIYYFTNRKKETLNFLQYLKMILIPNIVIYLVFITPFCVLKLTNIIVSLEQAKFIVFFTSYSQIIIEFMILYLVKPLKYLVNPLLTLINNIELIERHDVISYYLLTKRHNDSSLLK